MSTIDSGKIADSRTQNWNKDTSKYPTISPLAKHSLALLENAFEFRRALGPPQLLPA